MLQWSLVIALAVVVSSCATLGPRTSGVDNLIEWQAVDLKLDRKDLSSPWVYSFTLQLRDLQRRRVAFTEMERHLYQPGTGTSSGTDKGAWTIPAGGQLRIPMWSSLRCQGLGEGCAGSTVPIPLWKITLSGTDDAGRSVRTVINLRLPADPPRGAPSAPAFSGPVAAPAPAAATTALTGSGQPIATAASSISVPIQIIENVILVPVTVNRSHGATFLLDTGAQYTVLTPELAGRLGLVIPPDAPTKSLAVFGGQRITVPFVRLPLVELGTGRIENIEVGVHAVAPDSPVVDGVLGNDVLGRFTMTVDRAARQLRLEPVAR